MATLTIDELEARQVDIKARLKELDTEYRGEQFSDDAKEEWNGLNEEIERNVALIGEIRARNERLVALDQKGAREDGDGAKQDYASRVGRPAARTNVPADLFDLPEYRTRSASAEGQRDLMHEGALRAVEQGVFPRAASSRKEGDTDATREAQQGHVEQLLNRHRYATENSVAERILVTGSPTYKRAFAKKLAGKQLTTDEIASLERAASLTTTAGGFAVPYELDPSIILTSNGRVNPMRQVARIETTTVNDWKGVSSDGVTASYDGEAVEVSDDAPTLAQPTSSAVGARAFVPFSIEIGQDWATFGSEMARLFQDAKDELEGNKFILGTGAASPQGMYTGATSVVTTAGATLFAIADLYSLDEALPPRFHPNASIMANRKQFNRVRAFDTAGGAGLWVQLRDGLPSNLLGLPNYENSNMVSTLTSGSSIITIGDYNHYLIQDRLGMEVELIPHLFHTSNNLPSGQRGLFAIWRNNGKVLAWQAFRTLKVT